MLRRRIAFALLLGLVAPGAAFAKGKDKDKPPPRFSGGRPEDGKDPDKKGGIESALNRNLIELSVHAAAAFYERYPPKTAPTTTPPTTTTPTTPPKPGGRP